MANIIELREMSDDKLEEMAENAREELFNLRFQKATTRLENPVRMREVRRELAQFETVLRMRELAVKAAVQQPEVANALADRQWGVSARFDYEQSGWVVEFSDKDGAELATALVNLNHKQPKGRRNRGRKAPSLVKSYEVAG
jgi:large subunit ribosomal protein L29